jgi:hypothetical protein
LRNRYLPAPTKLVESSGDPGRSARSNLHTLPRTSILRWTKMSLAGQNEIGTEWKERSLNDSGIDRTASINGLGRAIIRSSLIARGIHD